LRPMSKRIRRQSRKNNTGLNQHKQMKDVSHLQMKIKIGNRLIQTASPSGGAVFAE